MENFSMNDDFNKEKYQQQESMRNELKRKAKVCTRGFGLPPTTHSTNGLKDSSISK